MICVAINSNEELKTATGQGFVQLRNPRPVSQRNQADIRGTNAEGAIHVGGRFRPSCINRNSKNECELSDERVRFRNPATVFKDARTSSPPPQLISSAR